MSNKNSVILFFILGFVLFLAPYLFKSSTEQSDSTLIVGMQSGYPPFEFMDAEGQFVGFDIDLAHTLAEKMGKKLILKDMEFEGLVLALKQGKIDVIISGMNMTPSRLNEIAMVPYHGEMADSLSLIFWKSIPENVHSLEDLGKVAHASVTVESGSVPEAFMAKHKDITTKSFQGALAPLMDVKWGKSTANLVEPAVAKYLKHKHPEILIVEVPMSKEDQIMGFGIGIKNENQELIQSITQSIQELKASGKTAELEKKWFEGGKDV